IENLYQKDLAPLQSRNNIELKEKDNVLQQKRTESRKILKKEEEHNQQLLKEIEKEQLKQLRIEIAVELPNCPGELKEFLISGELSLIGMKYKSLTTETEKLMTALLTGLTRNGLTVEEYFKKMDEHACA